MKQTGPTKARMLASTVMLLGQRGTRGTSIDAVLAHSGAPRGSVYHHFPGGRVELIDSAVKQVGDHIGSALERVADSGGVRAGLEQFMQFWKQALIDSDYRAGCPVVAVAVDSQEHVDGSTTTVAEIFARWHRACVSLLARHGHDPVRADRLATLTVSAIEGAVIMCRAQRTVEPLDAVLTELLAIIAPSTERRPELDDDLERRTVSEVMITTLKTLPVETAIERVQDMFEDPHVHMVLLTRDGQLHGTVLRNDLPPDPPSGAAALGRATLHGRTIGPHQRVVDAHRWLVDSGQRRLAVVGDGDELLGLLCLKSDQSGFCTDDGIAARALQTNANRDCAGARNPHHE